jgi:hypothetical protein
MLSQGIVAAALRLGLNEAPNGSLQCTIVSFTTAKHHICATQLLLYCGLLHVCRASLRLRSNQALNGSLQWAYYPSSFATGFETKLTASRGGFM